MNTQDNQSKRQTCDQASLSLKRLLDIIDEGRIEHFCDLVSLVFNGSSEELQKIVATKTVILDRYIGSRRKKAEDLRNAEESRIREAYRNRELHDVADMSREEAHARLAAKLEKMSRGDIEHLLAYIAGERGVKNAREQGQKA